MPELSDRYLKIKYSEIPQILLFRFFLRQFFTHIKKTTDYFIEFLIRNSVYKN